GRGWSASWGAGVGAFGDDDLRGFGVVGVLGFGACAGGGAPSLVGVLGAVDDARAVGEDAEAVAVDDGVVDEDVLSLWADDEAVALAWVEPLDRALDVRERVAL